MFSDAFSEGQARDINAEFPSESSLPYTEVYDYLSDSDLEDECSCSEEEYAKAPESGNLKSSLGSRARGSDPQVPSTAPSKRPPRPSPNTGEAQDDDRLASRPLRFPTPLVDLHFRAGNVPPRTGKVAIIRDMAAVSYVKSVVN